MAWSKHHDSLGAYARLDGMTHSFNVNEQCFIRKAHRCGKVFGASKSCFIACPTDDGLETILELMSEKLAKVGIEPIIAVKERAYGQDIFCTKICGKIIEARFCIVILDDTISTGVNIPNPNVYYEYGLMTSLRKHIVPLQKDDLNLAFNIQSYDTIKYNSRNIGSELDRAIKDAIKITEAKEPAREEAYLADRSIMRKLELSGLQVRDNQWFLWSVIDDTDFIGFGQYDKNFYVYLGRISNTGEMQTYLEDLDVVLYRTEKKAGEIQQELEKAQQREKELRERIEPEEITDGSIVTSTDYLVRNKLKDAESTIKRNSGFLELMDTIFIGFIVDPKLPLDDFKSKSQSLVDQYSRYKLTFNDENRMNFGDITVSLAFKAS